MTTVVARAGGGSLLTQPASMAPRINKLDTTFIYISSFIRTWSFEEPFSNQVSLSDMGLPAMCRPLIAHAYVVGRLHIEDHSIVRLSRALAGLRSAGLTRGGPNIEFAIARMCVNPSELLLAK